MTGKACPRCGEVVNPGVLWAHVAVHLKEALGPDGKGRTLASLAEEAARVLCSRPSEVGTMPVVPVQGEPKRRVATCPHCSEEVPVSMLASHYRHKHNTSRYYHEPVKHLLYPPPPKSAPPSGMVPKAPKPSARAPQAYNPRARRPIGSLLTGPLLPSM